MAENSWIRIGATKINLDAGTINHIITTALGKRATSITQNPELRQAIGEKFIEAVTPFVPMKTGALRDSGRATDDGRVYWTAINKGVNYAPIVYDEDYERWPDGVYKRPTTPNTFPQWTDKVQPGTAEWDAFVNTITPIILEAFKNE